MTFNGRTVQRAWNTVVSLKIWQLAIILFFMLFVTATLLRLNNLGMAERRAAVIEADKTGDQQAIESSLQELRQFVNAHMNTDLGEGVYLERSYARARDIALEQATDSTNPNSAAYQQASVECRSRFQGGVESYRNDYVQCVIDQVGALTQAEDPMAGIAIPRADLYRHDFVSPVWSFDAAGISVLLSLLIGVLIVVKLILSLIARMMLKRHYHSLNS